MFKKCVRLILVIGVFFSWLDLTVAHPMDAGRLQVEIEDHRALFKMRLHQGVIEKLLNRSFDLQKSNHFELAETILKSSLGLTTPLLNNETCEWRKSGLSVVEEADRNVYYDLDVVAVCNLARLKTDSMEMEFPFLQSMSPVFRMITLIHGLDDKNKKNIELILSSKNYKMSINPGALTHQNLFIKMGMAHIGVAKEEWLHEGSLHWPEGIDHILFVLALVLISSNLITTIKNATGFTLGHTLTLILSTYNIIHVHSHWVEALIALSITVVVGVSFFKKTFEHGFLLNMALGTFHGLGFASVIHDLQLPQEKVLPTLLSFNFGVELGQIVIILLAFFLLGLFKKANFKFYYYTAQALRGLIFIVSFYWFCERGLG